MYQTVKSGWERSSRELAGTDGFWERSALGLSLLRDLRRVCLTPQHIRGRVLDAGAGTLSYRHVVKPYAREYRSLDLKATHPDLDYLGDIQQMPLPDAQFDTVFSAEVLEHVPDPNQALREVYRVLKPGGKLVMSIPHLMYLHNEPNDFYRYTKYGLRVLLERAGFTVTLIEPSGGLFSFLQGLMATTIVGLSFGVPVIWPICFQFNRLTSWLAIWLDDHSDKKKIFALHFIAVAQKPVGGTAPPV